MKDKHIVLSKDYRYRAEVCYYDGSTVDCGVFDTLRQAQRELEKYPPDVWDGFAHTDKRYREPDEKRFPLYIPR